MSEVPITEHEGKKYLRRIVAATDAIELVDVDGMRIPVIEVDVYAVLAAYNVVSAPIAHALKKLLACGERGKGDVLSDLRGVLAAVNRAIDEEKIRQARVPMSKASKEWIDADNKFVQDARKRFQEYTSNLAREFRCGAPGSSSTETTSAGAPSSRQDGSPTG